jgi:hypothetical protein
MYFQIKIILKNNHYNTLEHPNKARQNNLNNVQNATEGNNCHSSQSSW